MKAPELVFAIVGATGTDHHTVAQALSGCLNDVGYQSEQIRVVDLLKRLDKYTGLPDSPEGERIKTRMDAGDDFRVRTDRLDALAAFSVTEIAERRQAITGDSERPAEGRAFILRSLKRTEEVDTLRRIYGDGFFLLGAYSPRDMRVSRLAELIARSNHDPSPEAYRAEAETIVQRDLDDHSTPYGQRLRDTFALADVFIRADDARSVQDGVERFIQLLFGHPFRTPTRDEVGMYLAHAAALRSAALPRQVGAALTTSAGSVIATGCNDVPRAGGGQYWDGDADDMRDHVRGWDFSDLARSDMVADTLRRLSDQGWLSTDLGAITDDLVKRALATGGPLKGSQLAGVVEFGRVVHAEMDALTDAARRGVSTQGAILYTTTFPCHNCARHAVAAGVSRVVYVEPYPKSRAIDLHQDAISLEPVTHDERVRFEPFVGISARLYPSLFRMPARKNEHGQALAWHPNASSPRLAMTSPLYINDEQLEIVNFLDRLKTIGLLSPEE